MVSSLGGRRWIVAAVAAFLLAVVWGVLAVRDAVGAVPGYWVETTGIVVAGGDGPVIGFEDIAGRRVEFLGITEARSGEVVTVLYDPADPVGTAQTPAGRTTTSRLRLVVAAVLAALAALFTVLAARENRA